MGEAHRSSLVRPPVDSLLGRIAMCKGATAMVWVKSMTDGIRYVQMRPVMPAKFNPPDEGEMV